MSLGIYRDAPGSFQGWGQPFRGIQPAWLERMLSSELPPRMNATRHLEGMPLMGHVGQRAGIIPYGTAGTVHRRGCPFGGIYYNDGPFRVFWFGSNYDPPESLENNLEGTGLPWTEPSSGDGYFIQRPGVCAISVGGLYYDAGNDFVLPTDPDGLTFFTDAALNEWYMRAFPVGCNSYFARNPSDLQVQQRIWNYPCHYLKAGSSSAMHHPLAPVFYRYVPGRCPSGNVDCYLGWIWNNDDEKWNEISGGIYPAPSWGWGYQYETWGWNRVATRDADTGVITYANCPETMDVFAYGRFALTAPDGTRVCRAFCEGLDATPGAAYVKLHVVYHEPFPKRIYAFPRTCTNTDVGGLGPDPDLEYGVDEMGSGPEEKIVYGTGDWSVLYSSGEITDAAKQWIDFSMAALTPGDDYHIASGWVAYNEYDEPFSWMPSSIRIAPNAIESPYMIPSMGGGVY